MNGMPAAWPLLTHRVMYTIPILAATRDEAAARAAQQVSIRLPLGNLHTTIETDVTDKDAFLRVAQRLRPRPLRVHGVNTRVQIHSQDDKVLLTYDLILPLRHRHRKHDIHERAMDATVDSGPVAVTAKGIAATFDVLTTTPATVHHTLQRVHDALQHVMRGFR
jgi:hypothetical protein